MLDTKTWSYGDTVWSDLLTDFNGTAITYDEIGNPLTMGSRELSWRGRQHTQVTDGENEISYAYNGDGQRESRKAQAPTIPRRDGSFVLRKIINSRVNGGSPVRNGCNHLP